MNIHLFDYLLLFASSLVLVGLLTPLMRRIAISKEILDWPNSAHKSHYKPVPYLGGVAIILGIVLVTYVAILFSKFSASNFWLATSLIGPALVMGLMGLWDDIRSLHPFPRFIGQTIAGIVVAIILILNDTLGTPTGSIALDIFLTIIWIVGICNSINFFDNLDGGAAGTVAISSSTIAYLALTNNQNLVGASAVVISGATVGFLIWNRNPAKIYMGDAGSLFLGVLIATLTIRLVPDTTSKLASYAIPVLILAIPILDTAIAVTSRVMRRVSPFQGGKDHLSHRLIRLRISRRHSALVLWSLSLIFNLFAVLLVILGPQIEAKLTLLATVLWFLLFFVFIRLPSY